MSLPDGWTQTRLSEVCSKIVDGSHNPPKATHSGFPMLSARNIQDRRVNFDDFRFINEGDFSNEHARTNVQAGDVLLTIVGTIGRTAVVAEGIKPFALQRSVAVLKPKEIDPRYLSYLLESPTLQRYFQENAKGTAQKGIYLKALAEVEISLAPLNEQKRIADKLDELLARIDACRERLDRMPQILKRFRQAVLSAATSGVLTEEWREWKGRQLDWKGNSGAEVFPFITSGSRGWAAYYADSGSKFLRVGNLDHETIKLDLSHIQYVNPPIDAEGVRTKVKVGDILISITADVGMIGFVSEDIGEAYINQHLCLARQNGSNVGAYLAYYLASPIGGLQQLTAAQRGATKAGLTLGDIRNIIINIPEEDEQHEIVRRVERLFAFVDLLEARYTAGLEQVAQLTPSLLDKAFRGELVPQDTNDEPASELLKRIKERKANEHEQKRKPRVNTVKNERYMKTKPITTLDELVSVLDQLGGDAMADRLVMESGLSDDIDRFFEIVREGRNTLLEVPVGSNSPIRRIVDANQ